MSLPSVGKKKQRELSEDLREVDALLDASEKARKAVGERTMRLMAEHAASQRDFERILANNAGAAKSRCDEQKETLEDDILPSTKSEEWEHRHRARCALLRVMEECWRSEQELADKLVAEDSKKNALDQLDRTRIRNRERLRARFDAYETKPSSIPGHQERMRKLKLNFPSPAEIVASVEAKFRNNFSIPTPSKTMTTSLGNSDYAREALVSAPLAAAAAVAVAAPPPRTTSKKLKKTKPGASIELEMAALALNDPTLGLPMQDLPSTSHEEDGKPQLLSTCVKTHAHALDLSFPALESYHRADQDSAGYYMPGYTAHLGEPHNRGGGFWSSLRADSRQVKKRSGRIKKSRKRRRHRDTGERGIVHSETSAYEKLSTAISDGGTKLLSSHAAVHIAAKLDGAEFREAVKVCNEALASALEMSAGNESDLDEAIMEGEDEAELVGDALAELLKATLGDSNQPTSYACERYATACAKAFRKNGRRLSFTELAKFAAQTYYMLEPEANSEAVALATTVADRVETTLRSMPLDVSDDLFEDTSVARFLRTRDFTDTIADCESTVFDAESAWKVVQSLAREKELVLPDAKDPAYGARATMGMYTENGKLPAADIGKFVRFALARSLLRARRDESRRSVAAENAFRRLLSHPPLDADGLRNFVEEMIGEGTIVQASAARAILEEEFKLSGTGLSESVSARRFLVDFVKPSFPPTKGLDLDRFLLYSSVYLSHTTPTWSQLESLLKFVAVVAFLDSRRAAAPVASSIARAIARDEALGEDPPPGENDLRLVRALHSAVRSAAGRDLDFDRALGALAGFRTTSIGIEEAAVLLGPFATFWGATEVVAAAKAKSVDPAVTRRVARLLASRNGRIDASALRTFLEKTSDPIDHDVLHDDGLDSIGEGEEIDRTIVRARSIVSLSTKDFAVLSLLGSTKSTSAWRIRATLFPGNKEVGQIDIEICRSSPNPETEDLPSPLLHREVLRQVNIRPKDGTLSHPLQSAEKSMVAQNCCS